MITDDYKLQILITVHLVRIKSKNALGIIDELLDILVAHPRTFEATPI